MVTLIWIYAPKRTVSSRNGYPPLTEMYIMATLARFAICMYEIFTNLHKMCLSDSYILLRLIYDFCSVLFEFQFRIRLFPVFFTYFYNVGYTIMKPTPFKS